MPVIALMVQADEDTVQDVARPDRAGAERFPDRVFAFAEFGPCGSGPPQPPAQTQALNRYLRWRNTNARHPDVLAAPRKDRARTRCEKGIRWDGRPLNTAA